MTRIDNTNHQEITMDKLISRYIGRVVHGRQQMEIAAAQNPETYKRKRLALAQDQMILGALKCARANGFSGEL